MKKLFPTLACLVLPFSLMAHDIQGGGGFMSGLTHPVLGLDHLLAMLSVGILSAQMGGKSIWTVPAMFVMAMCVGGIAGIGANHLPFIEQGIDFSVIALGLAIAMEKKLPVLITMLFVGTFGFFHGYAHGVEMPTVANPYLYAAGFVTGTASIHIAGVFIGIAGTHTPTRATVLRYAGAFIGGMGTVMLIG